MSEYIVREVVCDFGIYLVTESTEDLIDICNSRANALKICEILNVDMKHLVYKDKQISDLEAKLAEEKKRSESYSIQDNDHHSKLWQFYSRLGVEAFGADIHEKALETLMIMKEELKEELKEKNGVRRALSACNRQNDEFADMIKKLVGEKEELKQQLAEKDKAIENWQTMYESVVQTCHNDKEEIERLNKQLETQENTITNLVEDNRASQEWYKKQLADTEEQNKRVLEKLELIVSANQELEQKLAESEEKINMLEEHKFYADNIIQAYADKCKKADQDKISFAVEQLTEIRDYVKNCWSLDTTEGKVRLDIAKKIRLKIEELKGNENE